MGNIIDYLKEFGNASFQEYPLCEVDILLFSQLSYLKFDGCVPGIGERRKAVTLRDIDGSMEPDKVFADKFYEESNRLLWETVLPCRRYENMGIHFYRTRFEQAQQMQFGAMTFFPEGCEPVAAFRGTDDSILGWREDFNLALQKPIPSQKMSALYLNQIACKIPGTFMVCGHSKGGNLAVYASIWEDSFVQEKITDIYCLDGPGFLPEVLSGDSYENIRARIHRILPSSSLVGMLLQNNESYEVVQSSAFGLMQHDSFSWQIRDGCFVREKDIEAKQKRMNEVLNQWIFTLPEEARKLFVDTLFDIIDKTGAATVPEFADDWKGNLRICFHEMRKLEPETRKHIRQIIKILIEIYGSAMGDAVKEKLMKNGDK